jgi:hypothetical protein
MFDNIQWDGSIAPSLDALLRRASQVAEEMFEANGRLDTVWLIDSPDKGQAGLITPTIIPAEIDPAEYKWALSQHLHRVSHHPGR